MKNQNDLIFSIVAVVFGLILVIVFWTTAPQVARPADPASVDTSTPKLPSGDVQWATSLPGATNTNAGGGRSGGPMGMMGGRGGAGRMPTGGGGTVGGNGGGHAPGSHLMGAGG